MKPKIFAKRKQTILYQCGEGFSSHEREQKSSSFARKKLIGAENCRIQTLFECEDFSSCEEYSIELLIFNWFNFYQFSLFV